MNSSKNSGRKGHAGTMFLPSTVWMSIVALYLLGLSVEAQVPGIKNFDKQNYQGANQNWAIDFDANRLAYIGNNMGLLEYDGILWDLHPSPNGAFIRAVAADTNRIYTGGYRELGYWERDDTDTLRYTTLTDQVKDHFSQNEEFWNIHLARNQAFFQSFSGIYVFDGVGFDVIKPGGFINHSQLVDDTLFFCINNQGIYALSGAKLDTISEAREIQGWNIRYIGKTGEENHLLIGTESNGFFLFDPLSGSFEPWADHM